MEIQILKDTANLWQDEEQSFFKTGLLNGNIEIYRAEYLHYCPCLQFKLLIL